MVRLCDGAPEIAAHEHCLLQCALHAFLQIIACSCGKQAEPNEIRMLLLSLCMHHRLPNVPPNLCYAVHRLGHASARCVAYLHVRLVGVVSRQLQSLNTGSPKLHAACANSV